MKNVEWTPFKEHLKTESDFLHQTVPAIGNAYHSLLNSYNVPGDHGYRDRGYSKAIELLELLSVFPDKHDEELSSSESGSRESGYFPRLFDLTSAGRLYMPAMGIDLEIMGRLRKERLNPAKELVYKTVPSKIKERDGKYLFKPQEFADLVESLNATRQYWDLRIGLNYLRSGHFVEGKPVEELVSRFIRSLDAFGHTWKRNGTWNLGAGDVAVDRYGMINLAVYDAHTGSVIADALESDDPSEILFRDVPERGINELMFGEEVKSNLRAEMRKDLENDNTYSMCVASMIRRRGDLGKFLKYVTRLKKSVKRPDEEKPPMGIV